MNKSMNNLRQEWTYSQYVNREDLIMHAPYEPEIDFYKVVSSGNEKEVKKNLKEDFLKKEGLGTLSDNPIHNGKYHFVITAALVARECIKAGMSMEESYSLSDFYIQKADHLTTLSEITKLHDEMALDYTKRMNTLRHKVIYSKPIVKCINYIYANLHTKIELYELAELVSLSPTYLSKLFKKETGQTVSNYIATSKIETAKNMLEYSDYSISQIALILAYPSQSYFTEKFRKATGVTPKKYSHK